MRKVDGATCFAVHLLPAGAGLISHGELTIARFSLHGDLLWSTEGGDVFTGEFTVLPDRVRAVDWEGTMCEYALSDGRRLDVSA